jgi:hypothetical protein
VRRYKRQLTRLLEMVDQHKLAIASGELDKMPPLGMFYHHFYIPDSTVNANVELELWNWITFMEIRIPLFT